MFWFVSVSFVTVQKTMSVLHLMHWFGLETKRTHPIHFFGPNSDVLFRFGQFRCCAENLAGVAFNAPIRAVNEMKHSFGPKTKRTHQIHFFGPNSDLLVRFAQFRYCAKNHAGLHWMHRFRPEPKRTSDSCQKENECPYPLFGTQ